MIGDIDNHSVSVAFTGAVTGLPLPVCVICGRLAEYARHVAVGPRGHALESLCAEHMFARVHCTGCQCGKRRDA